MKRTTAALLAFVGLLGCEPRVIDALASTGGTGGTGTGMGGSDAHTAGASASDALAYYGFDEGTGSSVHDGSGHGHDGSLLGGAWTEGRFGSAIRLAEPTGSAEHGILVDPFPQPQQNWSVSLWLLVDGPALTGVSTVLSTEVTFAGGWEINLNPSDTPLANVEFAYWVGDRYAKAACDCVTLGAWTHVVAVVDGSALTIQLFHEGFATPAVSAAGKFMPGNPYLYMGRWGGTDRPLVGALDEVAIFDRALTSADIARLYSGVVP